jgi:cytochrome c553
LGSISIAVSAAGISVLDEKSNSRGRRTTAWPAPEIQGVFLMKSFRSHVTLAALVAFAGVLSFAQDGAALYKSKCAMCHGPTGTPSEGMAKAMGIKPVSDPSMKALSVDQISAAVKSGKGKMKPVAGLSDTDIKSVSEYFKSLK